MHSIVCKEWRQGLIQSMINVPGCGQKGPADPSRTCKYSRSFNSLMGLSVPLHWSVLNSGAGIETPIRPGSIPHSAGGGRGLISQNSHPKWPKVVPLPPKQQLLLLIHYHYQRRDRNPDSGSPPAPGSKPRFWVVESGGGGGAVGVSS